MKLYIIRHGETQWNKEKRLQGQCDIPLNDYGRELAVLTAKALENERFDLIYSSPLNRAYETAEIIRNKRNLEIITDERLKEISFGQDEGVPMDELGKNSKNFFFAPDKYIPSEGGETYEALCERLDDFIKSIIFPLKNTDKNVLIVAHGATNKALMLLLKKLDIADIWKGEFQKNCCVNLYEITDDEVKIIYEAKIYYDSEVTDYLK